MKRFVTGTLLILLIVIPTFAFADTIFLPFIMSIFSTIALYEIFSCIDEKKNLYATIPLYVISLALPYFTRYFPFGDKFAFILFSVIFAYILYLMLHDIFSPKLTKERGDFYVLAYGLYIIGGFFFMIFAYRMNSETYAFPLVFAIPIVTDTFCYIFGMLFGRHKLCPKISPKKTIEGAVGGTVMGILITLLYYSVLKHVIDTVPPAWVFLLFGFVLSVLGQLGDLIASVIKRRHNIKDFGNIFPGHGGVMDRVDSILAVSYGTFFVYVFYFVFLA